MVAARAASHPVANPALAREARERFADEAACLLDALSDRIADALGAPEAAKPGLGLREVMDAEDAFRQRAGAWEDAARRAWQQARDRAVQQGDRTGSSPMGLDGDPLNDLSLVDEEQMERSVLVGRLVAAIRDKAGQELSHLRVRMQRLEGGRDFAPGDVLRPATFAQTLLDAWAECGLTREYWMLAREAAHACVTQGLRRAYQNVNAFLAGRGVIAEIDLRAMMRRAPGGVSVPGRFTRRDGGAPVTTSATLSAPLPSTLPGVWSPTGAGMGGPPTSPATDGLAYAPPGSAGRGGYEATTLGSATGAPGAMGASRIGSADDFIYAPPGSIGRAGYEAAIHGAAAASAATGPGAGADIGAGQPLAGDPARDPTWWGNAPDGASAKVAVGTGRAHFFPPLGGVQLERAQRAQGVLGNLRQFVARYTGAALTVGGAARPASPALAQALTDFFPNTEFLPRQASDQDAAAAFDIGVADVDKVAQKLKGQAGELKGQTARPDEKAIIEIVSLMFQAILADERMPPALRVWFGRLQVPVLRVALAEPEFFATPEHPARLLIDRMGACAMGLDNAKVDDGRLAREVKRIVQVIEQYPETGQKAFQVVLGEFEQFLGGALTGGQPQKFATLAQQIEQKDALTIQYTIELRRMLGSVPVSDEVREFLFRVWAEVLALATVRHGARAAETVRFKQAATDLLWAVGPKADRAERLQVTQHLPGILQTLRAGMQTLAMRADEQDGHIGLINRAVALAFQTNGQGIPPAQMNELARAFNGLEDVISDDPEGDLLLDPALLEQLLGVESRDLRVIASGGVRPDDNALNWARALHRGQWFTLRQQDATTRVQYVWRSARGQLHLLASATGTCYLIQTRRLAAYLQAGLLTPLEDDALTTRATRTALAQLSQRPELLFE